MYALNTYEQTGVYDPNNPNQRIREAYVPGGYASFYFNRVPTTSSLRGLGLDPAVPPVPGSTLPMFATMGAGMQMAVVAAVGAVAGFFAMRQWGDKLKPTLRKLPVVGQQFAGLGGRRRRRR